MTSFIKFASIACCLSLLIQLSVQDLFLQNPRGSNNRLKKRQANAANQARLFDSQNNAKGGYNVGIGENDEHFQMKYFEGSNLRVEWTNQHGCGTTEDGVSDIGCNFVLQYMCQVNDDPNVDLLTEGIRDGLTENTNKENDPKFDNGLHESNDYYQSCRARQRNKGLFTADQNMNNRNKAIHTRQNRNGNRRGFECPEERDYWPYWGSSPWNDIAYITSQNETCNLVGQSSNLKPRGVCVLFDNNGNRVTPPPEEITEADCLVNPAFRWIQVYNYLRKQTAYGNQENCEKNGYTWGVPFNFRQNRAECLELSASPECLTAQATHENHLGNHLEEGNHGTGFYNWKLPYFNDYDTRTCVFRIRYNITSDSYDPWNTFASENNNKDVISNNPNVQVGKQTVKLNINTAQVGRVFQDRSHSFLILPRKESGLSKSDNVYNLNVRGKSGNIVQTFPATEYDFVPQYLSLNPSTDILHVQWTGSNTNNDNNANNIKADRNNFVITGPNNEYPIEPVNTSFFNKRIRRAVYLDPKTGKSLNQYNPNAYDLALYLSSSGKFYCEAGCDKAYADGELEPTLNNGTPSLPGVLITFAQGPRERFNTMCTVNNNFSNRRHHAIIEV